MSSDPTPGWSSDSTGREPGESAGGQPPAAPPPFPGAGPSGWGLPPSAPRPGIIPLRPLSFGEILEGSLRLLRFYAGPVLGLAAALAAVQTAVTTGLVVVLSGGLEQAATALVPTDLSTTPTGADEAAQIQALQEIVDAIVASGALTALAVASLISGLVSLLAAGLFTALTGEAVLGRPLRIAGAWHVVRPRIGALIITTLLYAGLTVGYIVALALLVTVAAALGGAATGALIALILVAGLVVAVWVLFRLTLANTVVVLEKARPLTALRRSWHITRGSWGRVFGLIVVTSLLAAIVGAIISAPIVALGTMAGLSTTGTTAGAVVASNALSTFVQSFLSLPFVAAAISLLYIDLRMRKENLAEALIQASQTPPTS